MARLDAIKIIAISLIIRSSLSLPAPSHNDPNSIPPRAESDCFATAFGINDFKSFSGSDIQPAFVSFKTGVKDVEGDLLCSRGGDEKMKSPYFVDPLPCKKPTGSPNIFFSYPKDGLLRVYQVTSCGNTQ